MNIKHVEEEFKIPDSLQQIYKELFLEQMDLISKYHAIELRNGTLLDPNIPVNLETTKGQSVIKDRAWRVTEELGEAYDAETKSTHFLEELIDALHFMIELLILAGFSSEDYVDWLDTQGLLNLDISTNNEQPDLFSSQLEFFPYTLVYHLWNVVYNLGLACNCLKQKPWKQSHQPVDMVKFKHYVFSAMAELLKIFPPAGLDLKDIYVYYMKKNRVNHFRIRSNY